MNTHRRTRQAAPRWCRALVIGAAALAGAARAQPAASAAALAAPPAAGKTVAAPRAVAMPPCAGELGGGAGIAVAAGKSVALDLHKLGLPAPAWLRGIGDTDIVRVEPMATSQPVFFLFGRKVGATNLVFQGKDGRCAMVDVAVGIDGDALAAALAALMPEQKAIQVGTAADAIVLRGSVSDALAVERVVALAGAFMRKAGGGGGASAAQVVNLLSVDAPQQVMLEVKVAEISKTLVDQFGADFSGVLNRGDWVAGLVTEFLSNSAGTFSLTKRSSGKITIDAERRDALVKVLAEPTIMAISGQEGSFLAGGKIFIPVAQTNAGGAATITLEEKEFGIGLRFTPTVLEGGRINLKVAPEVSELSREGVGISAAGLGGNAVLPFVTTRRAATTVQLGDGQSFAIAGLIKNNVTQNIKAFPVLGELPVLGALFRSSNFQTDKSELVFVITPRLVKPLPPNYALPTDHFSPPTRGEFFLQGKMEGAPPPAHPGLASGARTDAPAADVPAAGGFEPR